MERIKKYTKKNKQKKNNKMPAKESKFQDPGTWLQRRFYRFWPYMGMGAIFVMWPRLHIKSGWSNTCITPGQGQTNTIWSILFLKHVNFLPIWSFVAIVSHLMTLYNSFSHSNSYKFIGFQIWPCPNMGQGQPMVINYVNIVELHPDAACQVSRS